MALRSVLALSVGCSASSPEIDPERAQFGSRTYAIDYSRRGEGGGIIALRASDDALTLAGMPSDVRHLSPCPAPRILSLDADEDGALDLAFYSCGALRIWLAADQPLSKTPEQSGERKGGRWIRLDPAELPGLRRLDSALIRRIDPEA